MSHSVAVLCQLEFGDFFRKISSWNVSKLCQKNRNDCGILLVSTTMHQIHCNCTNADTRHIFFNNNEYINVFVLFALLSLFRLTIIWDLFELSDENWKVKSSKCGLIAVCCGAYCVVMFFFFLMKIYEDENISLIFYGNFVEIFWKIFHTQCYHL